MPPGQFVLRGDGIEVERVVDVVVHAEELRGVGILRDDVAAYPPLLLCRVAQLVALDVAPSQGPRNMLRAGKA